MPYIDGMWNTTILTWRKTRWMFRSSAFPALRHASDNSRNPTRRLGRGRRNLRVSTLASRAMITPKVCDFSISIYSQTTCHNRGIGKSQSQPWLRRHRRWWSSDIDTQGSRKHVTRLPTLPHFLIAIPEDELQNVEINQEERRKKNQELEIKRRDYRRYDDERFASSQPSIKRNVLSKYEEDTDGETKRFVECFLGFNVTNLSFWEVPCL